MRIKLNWVIGRENLVAGKKKDSRTRQTSYLPHQGAQERSRRVRQAERKGLKS